MALLNFLGLFLFDTSATEVYRTARKCGFEQTTTNPKHKKSGFLTFCASC